MPVLALVDSSLNAHVIYNWKVRTYKESQHYDGKEWLSYAFCDHAYKLTHETLCTSHLVECCTLLTYWSAVLFSYYLFMGCTYLWITQLWHGCMYSNTRCLCAATWGLPKISLRNWRGDAVKYMYKTLVCRWAFSGRIIYTLLRLITVVGHMN